MSWVGQDVPGQWVGSILLWVGPPERDEFLRDLFVDLPYVRVGEVQGCTIVGGLSLCLSDVV